MIGDHIPVTGFPDTIYAPASGGARAGVAILRLSGPAAREVAATLTADAALRPRYATRVTLRQPGTDDLIDEALALFFPAPASFTGEDVLELHLHGSPAVMEEMLRCLSALPGCRLAEPGEFTRRAFEHGKMDLTEAEGLADLIQAETRLQKQQALRQMQGELGRLYASWRETLLAALSHLEALIDFPEEEIPPEIAAALHERVTVLSQDMRAHLADSHRGEKIREGLSVAVIGPPNAGKSSIINALARREVAIVAARAGTTRDVIEVRLDLAGLPVTLADTAGIRRRVRGAEREGVSRARQRAQQADLTLVVYDGSGDKWPQPDIEALRGEESLTLLNKADLAAPSSLSPSSPSPSAASAFKGESLPLSAKTGHNVDKLLKKLEQWVASRYVASAQPVLTRQRHREALQRALAALERFSPDAPPELACEELRVAMQAVASITGAVSVEDVLDRVFAEFCIGK